jgi:hypothetical protein
MEAHRQLYQALRREIARGVTIGRALEICAAFEREATSIEWTGELGADPASPPTPWDVVVTPPEPDDVGPTLRGAYRDFMAWYGLRDGVLPVPSEPAVEGAPPPPRPRLHVLHDLFHVLGQYETSDADEVALHSFMFGQCALVQARFLCASFEAATGEPMFKHLIDLRDAALSSEDFERGARAATLVSLDYARMWDRPVEDLRRLLRIAPRIARPRGHRNTCGGVARPFWQTHCFQTP